MKKQNILLACMAIMNLFLIYLSGTDQARGSFIAIPSIVLINGFVALYGIVKQNTKLILWIVIFSFIALIASIYIFTTTFPFLTR
jgi:uncharacterized membrane protein